MTIHATNMFHHPCSANYLQPLYQFIVLDPVVRFAVLTTMIFIYKVSSVCTKSVFFISELYGVMLDRKNSDKTNKNKLTSEHCFDIQSIYSQPEISFPCHEH